jgi:hypothetical protein
MKRYERVTFDRSQIDVKRASVILEIINETTRFLTGYEVDNEGERIVPKGGCHERLHVIEKCVIKTRRPMRMNNKYAMLEFVP